MSEESGAKVGDLVITSGCVCSDYTVGRVLDIHKEGDGRIASVRTIEYPDEVVFRSLDLDRLHPIDEFRLSRILLKVAGDDSIDADEMLKTIEKAVGIDPDADDDPEAGDMSESRDLGKLEGSDKSPHKYGISVGTRVRLGRHDRASYDGRSPELNWGGAMDRFVGKEATITNLAGSDGAKFNVASVDIDDSRYRWRLANMVILPDEDEDEDEDANENEDEDENEYE